MLAYKEINKGKDYPFVGLTLCLPQEPHPFRGRSSQLKSSKEMDVKRYKVRLNSTEKIEELLQEIYDQACRQLNEIQNEINKLTNSTNLGSDDFTMEDKAKYFKAVHDLMGDKKQAIASKFEIAKFMGEMLKHNGDANAVINDKKFQKRTALKLDDIRAAINDGGDDCNSYSLKKNETI